MRRLAMVALAVMCVAGTASVATAQGGGGRGFNAMTQMHRWLTTPDTIKVSADVEKKIDDLAAKFTDDRTKAQADTSGGRAGGQARNADLTTKYQAMVKALLSPADQATFDKNVAAQAAMRGRRGGN